MLSLPRGGFHAIHTTALHSDACQVKYSVCIIILLPHSNICNTPICSVAYTSREMQAKAGLSIGNN